MKKSLAEVFSYLKIDFSNEDQEEFINQSLEEINKTELFEMLQQIFVNNMTCSNDGNFCFTMAVPKILSAQQILFLEEKFEKHFAIPSVVIKQKVTEKLSAEQKVSYLKTISPWIKKHASNASSIESKLFAQGKLELRNEAFAWQIEPTHYDIVNNQETNWLLDFWYIYGTFPYEIILESSTMENSLLEKIETTEQLFTEANLEATELFNNEQEKLNKIKQTEKRIAKSNNQRSNFRQKHRKSEKILWGRTGPPIPLQKISEIDNETDRAMFEGQVFMFDTRITRNGRLLVKFAITDFTTSISCTIFSDPAEEDFFTEIIKDQYLRVTADVYYDDRYAKDFVGRVTCLEQTEKPAARQDNCPKKRVELHIHSKMSAKDGTINPKDIVRTAAEFGHKAVAITDHGVMQGFPEVCDMADQLNAKGKPIKVIYGVEGYLLDDGTDFIAYQVEQADLASGFIIFNLETTGTDPKNNYIKQISALKFEPDKQEKSTNELKDLPETSFLSDAFFSRIVKSSSESEIDTLNDFSDFIGDLPLVAVDALNQLNFLRYGGFRVEGTKPRVKFNPPLIDLGKLAETLPIETEDPDFSLLKKIYQIEKTEHLNQAELELLGQIFLKLIERSESDSLQDLNRLVGWESFEELKQKRKPTNHIVLLAEDSLGLYNLYRMISDAHLNYFYYNPRIPRSVLDYYGVGVLKGMACVDGEIFEGILELFKQFKGDYEQIKTNLKSSELIELAGKYDYLEIQPLTNNKFLLRKSESYVQSEEDLKNLNRLVLELGKLTGKLVCATCDAHFLNPEDDIFRKILMSNMNFEDMEEMADLYFRTTDEMLSEFSYLGKEVAEQVVITNTNLIADQVSPEIRPFPKGSFPPLIKSADREIRELTMHQAEKIYGKDGKLPQIVEERINRELTSIIDNGFAVMYYISHCVVKKSNEDGYVVGSRGSVGSSLVATLCGITEVNPLQPHYVCPACNFSEFDASGDYGSGYDLPAKTCPDCGTDLVREGHDIPFETFLGFAGDKQPDIDLNFSGFYQATAHRFIEEMFGAKQTFRAGTISSYAEKNSAGMVLNYHEENELPVSSTEVTRLAQGLLGVKATTGQHPGGIVVVPKERDIFDFTPIQYPANKKDSGVITTHFDFHSLDETILKLDILGHDDPSMLKVLGDNTGVDVSQIPITDEKVMSLFNSTEALGIPDRESTIKCATIGLPELGTMLVRNMIAETKPTGFHDLVQISGLSHGTDVWTGNAQELIRNGTCTINEVIGCRDNIMTYLIYRGLPKKSAFDIMESVRRGRGLSAEQESMMYQHDVPEWYVESCKKIKYMFPKAHAVAYIVSALRIAWFKVYYPEQYYCAFFTIRANEFASDELILPPNEIRIRRAEQRRNWNQLTDSERKRHFYLELVEEMQQRGIDFLPIDIKKSKACEFYSPGKGKIRPPFNAIPNISETLSKQIVNAREQGGDFKNREELARRAELGQAAIEALVKEGVLEGMAESAQIDLFSILDM